MYSGIVIDSASFEELPGAILHVKHSERKTVSSIQGNFNIQANQNDTLIFTMLGYHPFELPLFFEEDVLLIRMSEQVILLNEITIRATRLYPNEVVNRTKATPKKMSGLDGIISPIDYFWKLEREKRKLSRIIEEHNKTQTYSQVVNDPVVKTIMMKAYNITELVYYEIIASFNQQRKSISYSNDPEEIMESLHDFFLATTKRI
ncbi:MAG: carboxypeptidase-like regulatory domain-containing protein [Bacteroidia bacterium]|nr:carboxypeptidase-like regulatory domain-containing protein [Bacteroidia bacterium]